MKLYNSMGPNPHIVRMFAAEAQVELELQDVDLMGGANRQEDYLKVNPAGQLPCLELADGSHVAEVTAICEYLDEVSSATSLIGGTPEERANTRMWTRRVDLNICEPLANGFRYAEGLPIFKERMITIPEAADGLKSIVREKLQWLDGLMGDNEWVCGDRYTLADITLYGMVWFFCVTPGFGPPFPDLLKEELPWVWAWYRRVAARAATKACDAGYAERGPLKN